eukprot:gnl/Spiro4/10572_TR5657_c0_g1_i1.p1 gnl/Spiro4/10572_TR5657_c0_g1~~gnl/Spiro4/10572_TR5657_c0_g1_i1.p1  ORF type:complete len:103 (-),score=20.64 gnl/Spiro4/10572_TR5657_c0_g1_i1:181-489(-)
MSWRTLMSRPVLAVSSLLDRSLSRRLGALARHLFPDEPAPADRVFSLTRIVAPAGPEGGELISYQSLGEFLWSVFQSIMMASPESLLICKAVDGRFDGALYG